jgi:endoglucanase
MKLVRNLAAIVLAGAVCGQATSIVERRGAPRVVGSQIVDKDGVPLQMTGMSLFWHQWMGQYYNQSAIDTLVSNWQANIIRVAMGVSGSGCYLTSPASTMRTITPAIDAAITDGIYVIIDWHEQDAALHVDSAKKFFAGMARKYGDLPNVIFEIWNEPYNANADYSWTDIKTYAQAVIPEIRKYSQNLVVVGTEFYSSNLADPAADPIDPAVYGNVAYTYHFYTCTHKLGSQASSTIPIFVTEWGTSASDGGSNGKTCLTAGQGTATPAATWFSKWLDPKKVSSCNWSISNKTESSSALGSTASETGADWDPAISATSLTTSGTWVRDMIRSHCTADPTVCPYEGAFPVPPVHAIPGTIPATEYLVAGGVARQATTEASGGQELFSIDSTDSVSYSVSAASDDTVWIQARVAGVVGGTVAAYLDGVFADSIYVAPGVASAWTWAYGSRRIPVAAGAHRLKFLFNGQGKDLLRLQRLEIVHRDTSWVNVPGGVPFDQLYYPLAGMGLGVMSEGQPPALRMVRSNGQAIFQVYVPAPETLSVAAYAQATGANPASITLSKKVVLKNFVFDTLTFQPGAGFQVATGARPIPLDSGFNNITVNVIGDAGVPLLDIAALSIGGAVSVHAPSVALTPTARLHRFGNRLRVELPRDQSAAELSLVSADGKVWDRARAEQGAASLSVPAVRRPFWVRIEGGRGAAIPVPPGF